MDRTKVVTALERLYGHHEGDLHTWARAVNGDAYSLLEEGSMVGCMIVDVERCHFMHVDGLGESAGEEYRDFAMTETPAIVTPERFASCVRGQHMVDLWSAIPDIDHALAGGFMGRAEAVDLLGITAEPEPGLAFILCVGLPKKRALRSGERSDLTRLALHLEASARARLNPDSVIGTVSLGGRFELAERVPSLAARTDVVEQIGIIENLRIKKNRHDGDLALAVWKALTTGSLSLLERIDTDGKRFYDLCENPPWRTGLRALSIEEAEAVSQATRGLANKEIGYALGRSQASVSRWLGTAARKLGLANGRALLRVAARLFGPTSAPTQTDLTLAEREVLRLLADGHSNRQIAVRRGVATRTVANQVASVLAKTGASSRRGLLGHSADTPCVGDRKK